MMDLSRFETLVEAWGAEPGRWPPAERAAAQSLVAADSRARACLDDARRLDDMLGADPAPAVSESLRARVLGAAPAARAPRPRRWLEGVGLAAVLAAACAAGAVTGVAAATRQETAAHAAAGVDPAGEAARLLAEPPEAGEG